MNTPDSPRPRLLLWSLLPLTLLFALLPIGRAAELPLLLAALAGMAMWIHERRTWRGDAYAHLLLAVFAAYWLPMLVSAFDALEARRAWLETAGDLRFLPFAFFLLWAVRGDLRWLRTLRATCAAILALWTLDALVQAGTGYSLGGRLEVDRLSGVFGDDNLKLGPVLAVFSPLLLEEARERYGRNAAVLAGVALGVAILLAGARASWLVFAIVVIGMLWRHAARPRQFAIAFTTLLGATLLIGAMAYLGSERLRARVERTLAASSGTEAGVDFALAGRLPIWTTAVNMAVAHPLNGVGVRGYRYAYARYAARGDRWVDAERGVGAYHPHQILLELAAETGIVGLACWFAGAALLLRAWRRASERARALAFAPGIALFAMTFPLNTHPAFYSSFWATVLWLLLAWFIAALSVDRAA